MKCPICKNELSQFADIGISSLSVIGLKCDKCQISCMVTGPRGTTDVKNPEFGKLLHDYVKEFAK